MEGYRASLILALPEFDTYKAIPAYARHPDDPVAAHAFVMLLERTRRRIFWDLHGMLHTHADTGALVAYRLGMPMDKNGKEAEAPAQDIASMSEDQQKATYLAAMRAAGMDIDPAVFMNMNGSPGSTSNGTE